MKRFVPFLFTILLPLAGWSQLNQVWQTNKTLGSNDFIESALEVSDGTIFAVGYSDPGPNKKQDAMVLLVDSRSGQISGPLYLGGKDDDVFTAAVQTNAGNIIIVGRTESDKQGKLDGWIVCTDNRGGVLWEKKNGYCRR